METHMNPDLQEWTNTTIKGFKSKILLSRENGSFKQVKVDPKSSFPSHLHPDKTEFVYVLQGNPEFLIDNVCHKGAPGLFFIIPPNVNHAIYNNTETPCLLLVGAIKQF